MTNQDFMLAGFGGQGILFAGRLLAYAALIEGREVSWLPSYGPEMRGGTANCSVCISDEPIGSPLVTEPDVLVAMNLPSYEKFISDVKTGGTVVVDSSIADVCCAREDVMFYRIPATQLAETNEIKGLGNVIIVGMLLRLTGALSLESVDAAIEKSVSAKRLQMIEFNKKALRIGYDFIDQGECLL